MNEMERMRDLVARLNAAAKVYYQGEDEIMTNFEYDALYDELVALEEKTGVVLSGSPTRYHLSFITMMKITHCVRAAVWQTLFRL